MDFLGSFFIKNKSGSNSQSSCISDGSIKSNSDCNSDSQNKKSYQYSDENAIFSCRAGRPSALKSLQENLRDSYESSIACRERLGLVKSDYEVEVVRDLLSLSDGDLVENYSDIKKFTSYLSMTNSVLQNLLTNSSSNEAKGKSWGTDVNDYMALLTQEDLDLNDSSPNPSRDLSSESCGLTNFFGSSMLNLRMCNNEYVGEIDQANTNERSTSLNDCNAAEEVFKSRTSDTMFTESDRNTPNDNFGDSSMHILREQEERGKEDSTLATINSC